MKIALLGAESTGKTQLARELAAHYVQRGERAEAVGEVLREWCTRQGRAPRPGEQLAIAQEQERRVDEAGRRASVVIADTTALMVAIYGAMLFADGDLHRFALERQRGYDVTLVTGLDLPWVADGLQRASPQVRDAVDAQLRQVLDGAGIAYRVVYGSAGERLRSALAAIDASNAPAPRGHWQWNCEKCSDPECEHRLFGRLLGDQAPANRPG